MSWFAGAADEGSGATTGGSPVPRRRLLLGCAIVVLLSRLLFLQVLDPARLPDEDFYENAAWNLASGHGARLDPAFVQRVNDDEQELFIHNRNIGYTAFLATIFRLAGRSELAVYAAQSLLDAAAAVILLLTAVQLGLSPRTAAVTSIAAFLYPINAVFSFTLLAETLFTFLCVVLTHLLVIAPRKGRLTWAVAGLIIGLAAMTRASLLFFPIFLLPYLLRPPAEIPGRRPISRIAIVLLVFVSFSIPCGLWTLRNQRVMGAPIFHYGGGWTLYESNNPLADGGPARGPLPREAEGLTLPLMERDRFFQRAAKEWILAHPGRFIALMPEKFIRFWNIVPNFERFRRSPWFELSAAFHVLLYALALAPLATSRGRAVAFSRGLPALLLILYFTLLHIVFLGSLRYRVPIMPQVFLFAGLGGEELVARFRGRKP